MTASRFVTTVMWRGLNFFYWVIVISVISCRRKLVKFEMQEHRFSLACHISPIINQCRVMGVRVFGSSKCCQVCTLSPWSDGREMWLGNADLQAIFHDDRCTWWGFGPLKLRAHSYAKRWVFKVSLILLRGNKIFDLLTDFWPWRLILTT